MKRIILALLFLMLCSVNLTNNTLAATFKVISGGSYVGAPIYKSDIDAIYIGINGKDVVEYRVYDKNQAYEEIHRSKANTYFTGIGIGCPGNYEVHLIYYPNGVQRSLAIFEIGIAATEVKGTSCNWDIGGEEPPTDPPTEPEEPTDPPTNPPTEPEEPVDECTQPGINPDTCLPWGEGEEPIEEDPRDPTEDCLYYPDLPICQEDPGDPPPEDNDDPYDRDNNGINDYLEQDWDDPKTVIPYCDQKIPGSDETFGEHPSVPCMEKDLDYANLPECDPEFIDWEPCREPGNLPWEEPYPEFDYPEEEPEECTMCKIFECPGWGEYMGFLEDLADDIVGDIEVPELPEFEQPSMPNIIDILNGVDERNDVKKPTGQEDPNLGNASFNADEIKNNSGEIEFREDPTGGFNITNPLESLPDDGSNAPRPENELESLPYPGAEDPAEGEGNRTPTPSNGNYEGTVTPPSNPGGTATPPTVGGTATPPTVGGTVKYPGVP